MEKLSEIMEDFYPEKDSVGTEKTYTCIENVDTSKAEVEKCAQKIGTKKEKCAQKIGNFFKKREIHEKKCKIHEKKCEKFKTKFPKWGKCGEIDEKVLQPCNTLEKNTDSHSSFCPKKRTSGLSAYYQGVTYTLDPVILHNTFTVFTSMKKSPRNRTNPCKSSVNKQFLPVDKLWITFDEAGQKKTYAHNPTFLSDNLEPNYDYLVAKKIGEFEVEMLCRIIGWSGPFSLSNSLIKNIGKTRYYINKSINKLVSANIVKINNPTDSKVKYYTHDFECFQNLIRQLFDSQKRPDRPTCWHENCDNRCTRICCCFYILNILETTTNTRPSTKIDPQVVKSCKNEKSVKSANEFFNSNGMSEESKNWIIAKFDLTEETFNQYLSYCHFELVNLGIQRKKQIVNPTAWFISVLKRAGVYRMPDGYSRNEKLEKIKPRELNKPMEIKKNIDSITDLDRLIDEIISQPWSDIYEECYQNLTNFEKSINPKSKFFEGAMLNSYLKLSKEHCLQPQQTLKFA